MSLQSVPADFLSLARLATPMYCWLYEVRDVLAAYALNFASEIAQAAGLSPSWHADQP